MVPTAIAAYADSPFICSIFKRWDERTEKVNAANANAAAIHQIVVKVREDFGF